MRLTPVASCPSVTRAARTLRGGYPESDSGNRRLSAAGCFAGLI